jgi:hypothetical protein
LGAAEENPEHAGVAARNEAWPSVFFREAVDVMKKVLEDFANENENAADYWRHLASEAQIQLPNINVNYEGDPDRRRAHRSVYIAILAALYNRVEKYRRIRLRQHGDYEGMHRLPGDGHLTHGQAAELLKEIEDSLTRHG